MNTMKPPQMKPGDCQRCSGTGKLATDDEESAWWQWEQLPPGSDLAVVMGLVKPKPCHYCDGTGRKP